MQIITQRNNHRLLVFSDGAGLFDPLSNELQPWTTLFENLPQRALLTPEAPGRWGYREEALKRRFQVLPANSEGLLVFLQALQGLDDGRLSNGGTVAALPKELQRRPQRWVSRQEPDESEIADLLAALKNYLGKDGFTWLCACAVYPELHWELTLYLGSGLDRQRKGTQSDGKPNTLIRAQRVIDLARLPWMRAGHMPN